MNVDFLEIYKFLQSEHKKAPLLIQFSKVSSSPAKFCLFLFVIHHLRHRFPSTTTKS